MTQKIRSRSKKQAAHKARPSIATFAAQPPIADVESRNERILTPREAEDLLDEVFTDAMPRTEEADSQARAFMRVASLLSSEDEVTRQAALVTFSDVVYRRTLHYTKAQTRFEMEVEGKTSPDEDDLAA